jgi:hypothetical protein
MALKNADGTIERLLAGLRDAEPPGGMERRILEALDGMGAREEAASTSFWRPAMALLSVCAVILFVAIAVQHRRAPANLSHSTKNAEERDATKTAVVAQREPVVRRRTSSRVSVGRPPGAAVTREKEAASFPAPPLPLTDQEKLLLRVAHRADMDKMALLNPDVRAAQTAKATEQFQQFFEINAKEMRSQSE